VKGGGIVTPKEIGHLLAERYPDITRVPEREREIIALYTIYLPPPRIAVMLGVSKMEVDGAIRKYGDIVAGVDDSIRMKILRMTIWRFAATAVSALMDQSAAKDMGVKAAIASLEKIPAIMDRLAETEKTLLQTEKQHKEMDFDGFAKSLTGA